MPVIKSAIKKARQDVKAREHNRIIRVDYKDASKNFRKLVKEGEFKKAEKALAIAFSKIDKAAKRNVIHKNNASRRKARLSALLPKKEKKVTAKK